MIDNKLRIVAGNTFATAHTITANDVQGQPIPDFDLQECTDIQVYARNGGSYKPLTSWQLDDQSVVVLWYGKQMKLGGYDFYIAGKFGGADWRTSEATIFEIVQYNEEANIPADTIVVDSTYFLDASFSLITEIQGGGGGATPSDDLPLMDGTADAGTSAKYSRGDHVHPSDTNKQDVIGDLDTIRSGAAAGATAVQPAALNGYQPLIDNANKLDYSLLDNTPTIPAAQVNSDWDANSGVAQILNKPTIPAAQIQSDWDEADNTQPDYIKNKPAIPSIAGLESTSNKVTSLSSASTDTQYPSAKCVYDGLVGKQDTIDSAHKLDYSLLDNTPTIPAAQVNSDWNASSGVAQILNKPTIPSVVDSLSSASTTAALSANQGKVLNDTKQPLIDNAHKLSYSLLDGTPTIPTALSDLSDDSTHRVVTDTQIATWNGKADKVLVVNHGTSDTTYSVTPNALHIWGTVASLTLTLATPTDNTIVNEYMIEFTSGSTATTLSLPVSVEWGNRDPLTGKTEPLVVAADATYQISIINNVGLWTAISNS